MSIHIFFVFETFRFRSILFSKVKCKFFSQRSRPSFPRNRDVSIQTPPKVNPITRQSPRTPATNFAQPRQIKVTRQRGNGKASVALCALPTSGICRNLRGGRHRKWTRLAVCEPKARGWGRERSAERSRLRSLIIFRKEISNKCLHSPFPVIPRKRENSRAFPLLTCPGIFSFHRSSGPRQRPQFFCGSPAKNL